MRVRFVKFVNSSGDKYVNPLNVLFVGEYNGLVVVRVAGDVHFEMNLPVAQVIKLLEDAISD